MSADPQRVEAVLAEAEAIADPAARATYLDTACAGDAALRAEVESLLAAYDAAGTFLDQPASGAPFGVPPSGGAVHGPAQAGTTNANHERPGDRIGRYKLLEQVGEGGFGEVWMAEQEEPVRRRVALKVIKLGMDTKSVIARFEAERQALAMMDHPNIARVLDGGATEAGRPYFVMELVQGISITAYCDGRKLSTRERLELFVPICQAVQHAHQKGVIHRDLKPSNILVTEQDDQPVPKVIDFGVAKATQAQLTERTLYTQFRQVLGTPAYMSPEQAGLGSLDMDTRSDIYSLGVLLYELLTGCTPFDPHALMQGGYDTIWRTIREVEPPKPSTRLSALTAEQLATVAAGRHADPEKLRRLIRGELDWIVMKAMQKDRRRRYETANGLAADLRRYLNHEPVAARPSSTLYQLGKAIRRNQVAFAAGAAVIAALVAGFGTTVYSLAREKASRQRAQAAEREQAVLRHRAEERERTTRENLYAVDMNLAQLALETGDRQRAAMLLDRHRPQPGQPDLRHWEWRYFWQLARSDELFTLGTHSNVVTSVAISRTGKFLVSGSYDGTVKLWDLPARRLLRTATLPSRVICVAISPDETRLAAGDAASLVVVWRTDSLERVAEHSPGRIVRAVCFSPDGTRLASYATTGLVQLWDVRGFTEQSRLSAEPSIGSLRGALAFSPDGSTLAVGQSSGRIRLVSLTDGADRAALRGHTASVTALAFTPDGQALASSSWDLTARVWEVASSRSLLTLTNHTAWVSSLTLSPDGKTLATASADQTIRLWELPSGKPGATLQGHRGEVWAVAFAPDGTLASGGKDDAIKFWSTSRRAGPRPQVPVGARLLSFAADGRTVAVLTTNGAVLAGDPRTLQFTSPWVGATSVLHFAFSPRDNLLATGHRDGRVQLWDAALRQETTRLLSHTSAVVYVHFSRDDASLCSLDAGRRWQRWDVATGREIATGQMPRFQSIEFSPDHAWVAIKNNRTIQLLDLPSGAERAVLTGHRENILSFGFSPDGRRLASSGEDGTVRVWEVPAGREVTVLLAHRNGAYSTEFSPDGRRLLTGGGEDVLKLWDTATWQEVATFQTAYRRVAPAFFSLDGHVLAARTRGRDWQFWRAPTFEEIAAAEAR